MAEIACTLGAARNAVRSVKRAGARTDVNIARKVLGKGVRALRSGLGGGYLYVAK